jgi:hypothetical protein
MNSLKIIRPLTHLIKDVSHMEGFPKGFCDIVTLRLLSSVPGAIPKCGYIRNEFHTWIFFKGINIDFTAHQFPELQMHCVAIDNVKVLFGPNLHFTRLGYTMESTEQCMNLFTVID